MHGRFYACKYPRTYPRVFVDISGRNSGQDGAVLGFGFGDVASQLSGYASISVTSTFIFQRN
jgi:hypothetical protein